MQKIAALIYGPRVASKGRRPLGGAFLKRTLIAFAEEMHPLAGGSKWIEFLPLLAIMAICCANFIRRSNLTARGGSRFPSCIRFTLSKRATLRASLLSFCMAGPGADLILSTGAISILKNGASSFLTSAAAAKVRHSPNCGKIRLGIWWPTLKNYGGI